MAGTAQGSLAPEPPPLYRYSPLPEGWIRLLRLMPHRDSHAPIRCQIFHYPLVELGTGRPHLYEALSYVWGSPDSQGAVLLEDEEGTCSTLPIRENLNAAFKRLRDPLFPRIFWIDAICINQEDLGERGSQVQFMALIYASASRVVVWLGEAVPGSKGALGEIQKAATREDMPSLAGEARGASYEIIWPLLRQPWFERIWVLQEVAAARHIEFLYGSEVLDGYTFSAGLSSLKGLYPPDQSDIQGVICSTIYLTRRTFTPMIGATGPGTFSLRIRPLAELIDMYHARKATDRRDKVYALLGMSYNGAAFSDQLTVDYTISWESLFRRVVRSMLGKVASVRTWKDEELAVIKGRGEVLGTVHYREGRDPRIWGDTQKLVLYPGIKDLDIHHPATPIQGGDLLCQLEGAPTPMIVRSCEDHWIVIAITTSHSKLSSWSRPYPDTIPDFLIVWDWAKPLEMPGHMRDYESFMSYRIPQFEKEPSQLERAARLRDAALILGIAASIKTGYEMTKAQEMLQQAIRIQAKALSRLGPTLALGGAERLVPKDWWEGDIFSACCRWNVEELKNVADLVWHSGKFQTITREAAQQIVELGIDALRILFYLRTGEVQVTGAMLKKAAEVCDKALLEHLLGKVPAHHRAPLMLQAVRMAVVGAGCSWETFEILCCHEKYGVRFRRKAGVNAATLRKVWKDLDVYRSIPETVVVEVLANRGAYGGLAWFLFNIFRADKVPITEEVLATAATNRYSGARMVYLLLKGGAEIPITEEVVVKAAENVACGEQILELLFQERGDEISITETVVAAAAKNWYGTGILKLLFKHRGGEVRVTERVIVAVVGNGYQGFQILELLVKEKGDEVRKLRITEKVTTAALQNADGGDEMISMLRSHGLEEETGS